MKRLALVAVAIAVAQALLICALTTQLSAQLSAQDAAPTDVDSLHAPLGALLQAHVSEGLVDYAGLAGQRESLRKYLADLGRVSLDGLSRDALLALWINAYNAATLELVLDHSGPPGGPPDAPIASIKDIPSAQRWKAERFTVAGRRLSLDAMEHEILRPMGDARVHFALVCASLGCPDLQPEAYLPSRVQAQLDQAARSFLANPTKGLSTRMGKGFFGGDQPELLLSKLFDWFESDFERDAGSVLAFVQRHAPADARAFISRHAANLDLEFMDYDWTLNAAARE